MSIEDRINQILDNHVGDENAISWMDLHGAISWRDPIDPSELRAIIKSMRKSGSLIASSSRGYSRPKSLKEAMTYIDRQFRNPAKDELKTARIQRKIAREQFGGQMGLW